MRARPLLLHQTQVYFEGSLNNGRWEDFCSLRFSSQCFLQLQTDFCFPEDLGAHSYRTSLSPVWPFGLGLSKTNILHFPCFLNHHSEESPNCFCFWKYEKMLLPTFDKGEHLVQCSCTLKIHNLILTPSYCTGHLFQYLPGGKLFRQEIT